MTALVPTAAQVELIKFVDPPDHKHDDVDAFAAEDCKPNKSLRTTIRVFLRTEEKKREALRLKDQKDTPPATPLEVQTPSIVTPTAIATPVSELKKEPSAEPAADPSTVGVKDEQVDGNTAIDKSVPTEAQKDVPQQSIEEIAPGQEETADGDNVTNETQNADPYQTGQEVSSGEGPPAQATPGMSQTPGFGMGFGLNPAVAGNFLGMPMMGQGGDFDQMQSLMAMQNGMVPNAFGGFPTGLPQMGMDSMAMQAMYGGFGVNGMGTNGIYNGWGMGGYDGGAGTGYNNGWNGQQGNIGNNFNHPNATSMGPGDFGANNFGFNRQNAAGFNQGNYGQQNQYNDLQNGYGHQGQGYYPRGRGRGRGFGYGQGRGGHNVPFSQQYPQNGSAQPPFGPMSETGAIPTGPKADTASAAPSNVDEFGREIRPTTEVEGTEGSAEPELKAKDKLVGIETVATAEDESSRMDNAEAFGESMDGTPKPVQNLQDKAKGSTLPSNFSANGFASVQSVGTLDSNWAGQGEFYNQGSLGMMLPPQSIQSIVSVPDVPINAPKGPKAMRDGLPNTSVIHLRGRGGFGNIGRAGVRPAVVLQSEPIATPAAPMSATPQKEAKDKERARSRSHSDTQSRSPVRSERSDSYERRKERRRERRRHRHRSTSRSEDEKEEERYRERRSRHSRRHEDDCDEKNGSVEGETKSSGEDHKRSRDQSPTESRRSNHRSRRERDNEEDAEREHKASSSSHKHRSSHRSHRSRSPRRSHRDRDRSRERERHRDRSRDRDRDREQRHRHRRESPEPSKSGRDRETSTVPPAVTAEPAKGEIKIPRGPKAMSLASVFGKNNNLSNGIGIKGSARRQSVQDDKGKNGRGAEERSSKDRDRERAGRLVRDEQPPTAPASMVKSKVPQGPKKEVDAHTREREARNRERLLKEAQRIAGLAGGGGGAAATAGSKRSRDEGSGSGRADGEERNNAGSTAGRKRGRRSEVEGSGLEERIARGESEREGARWG
ncbi:MAG: hypothetical protein M1818_007002 [Claussenomyces sp. TS43310]|nr:MAG: hypothetical protein M1818_007002 [Claussenomyces sp. TS43310]